MKNIRFMNYTELFDEFYIILNMRYMGNIITNEAVEKEFYRTYPRGEENIIQSVFLKKFFSKHFKDIDKEAYVFFTLKTLVEEIPSEIYPNIRRKCIDILRNSDYSYFDVNENAKLIGDEIRLIRASDLTGEKRETLDSENKKRVEELKEKVELRSLFTIHSTNELKNIYGLDDDLNLLLNKLGMIEAISEIHPLTVKDRIRLLRMDGNAELNSLMDEYTSRLAGENVEKFYRRFPEYLEKYPEYFDIDKILLIAAFRANQYLERARVTEKENEQLAAMLQLARDSIKTRSLKVRGLSNNDGSEQGKYDYSYKALLDACERITESGRYISTSIESLEKEDIQKDPQLMLEKDLGLVKIIHFNQEELNMISEYEGLFKFLVENDIVNSNQMNMILSLANVPEKDFCELIDSGKVDDTSISIYLKRNHIIGENLYTTLDSKGKMTLENKLEYYMDGRIELSFLEEMAEEERIEFRKTFNPHELIELYRDPSRETEYLRYAAYREFVINGLSKNEKEMLGEVIIEATDGDIEEEDLVKFYEQHLISISTLESWSGPSLVTKMMRKAKLRPADVKEICKNGNYDCILQIMRDTEIQRKNKLAIFYTTFADDERTLTEEQKERREQAKEEALKAMKLTEARNASGKGKEKTTRIEVSSTKKRNEYVSEPMNRWTLMKLLDEEYSYEMLDSGMMIFKLPNVKGGLIILEKMFKKEKPDYARATKIIHMTIEDFEKIKSDLVIDGDIAPTAVESHPALNEKFESIWHTSAWGERIAEIVGYSIDSRRSLENIENIEKEIEKIKQSRRLRE